jgi:hypothetical protein
MLRHWRPPQWYKFSISLIIDNSMGEAQTCEMDATVMFFDGGGGGPNVT